MGLVPYGVVAAAGVSRGSLEGRARPSPAVVADAVRERDRVDAELLKALVDRGRKRVEIDVEAVAESLPRTSAAVGYLRYVRSEPDPKARHRSILTDSLLAHVVLPDGRLRRIELGPIDAIDAAIERWRSEVGAPILRGATLSSGVDSASGAGEALRALILDPIFDAVGAEATTLYVCLDDSLHLVPLDALPLGRGVVGDRRAIRIQTSFASLIAPRRESRGDPPASMLVLGGIDFDAEGTGPTSSGITGLLAAPAPPVSMDRGGPCGLAFVPLRETTYEADTVGDLFQKEFRRQPTVLKGDAASKRAFHDRAPGIRYLHVATHGYFASESVSSLDDERDEASAHRMTLEETVSGLSPLALCGLALAGANRGMDSLGRVPGILTAEELSGADLSRCELAVLSACETNVGLRRAGRGIASLQAALHAAGARTAITSLWKVDDERTRELMVDFYRRIWVEKKEKAEALWGAKKALRAKGAPLRDWAGWVLTGEPD